MSRYIDADELKDFIFRWGGHSTVDDCIQWIEQTETADVRENVKGEWIAEKIWEHGENLIWKCSKCGKGTVIKPYHFCPNCGAQMT